MKDSPAPGPNSPTPLSFRELCERSRAETPQEIDVRFSVRAQLEKELRARSGSWLEFLSAWTQVRPLRTGFSTAVACFALTAYWELSRPEISSQPEPPLPPIVFQALLGE